MNRAPGIIKKDLVAARRDLKKIRTKERNALREMEHEKRHGSRASVMDRETKLLACRRETTAIEKEIKDLEVELVGDWAPKSWGGRNAS